LSGSEIDKKMAADANASGVRPSAPPDLTEQLKTNLDKVDLLIADLGQLGNLTRNADRFIQEATTELAWNRWARAGASIGVLVIVIVMLFFLRAALNNEFKTAFTGNPHGLSVLIGAVFGGVVVIAIAFTRAVHSTFAERNAGMPMPEHLKTVVDTIKNVLPGS
jgi:RsiW-degrading membrane proteinase PrsW (M82 family)